MSDPTPLAGFYLNLADQIQGAWPSDIIELPTPTALEDIWFEPIRFQTDPVEELQTAIMLQKELALSVPGLDGISLVLAANGGAASVFLVGLETAPNHVFKVHDVPFALRFRNDFLRPAELVPGENGAPATVKALEGNAPLDITFASMSLAFDFEGGFALDTDLGIDLPLCLIGDTGIGLQANDIKIYATHDTPPPGKPAGWRGIHMPLAKLYLPGELASLVGELAVQDAYFGHGGFSGTVSTTWPAGTPLSVQWMGLALKMKSVAISFVQNALTAASIKAEMTLPFFNEPINVELAPSMNGQILLRLDSPSGGLLLHKPNIVDLTLNSLGIKVEKGRATCLVSGMVKPLIGGLDLPAFDVKELAIDTDGNVKLEGGWLGLKKQYSVKFHGFKFEVTKLGIGQNTDGGKWIALNGGIKFVEKLPMGASVDGLRLTWYDDGRPPAVSFEGVGVEFEVPKTLRFKGAVAYHNPTPDEHRFEGAIKLDLLALNITVDGQLVFGTENDTPYFAIYLGTELPTGIPLWATGLGLYGIAGLLAVNMKPDKQPDQTWYDWYHAPTTGVTSLTEKWAPAPASLALGAGVTIGTLSDNGYAFAGRMLLAIVFPGPVLMIEGIGNIKRPRSELTNGDPMFRAIMVIDADEGSFLAGLDAHYRYGANGELLDLSGSAEAAFSLNDPSKWHVYLGQKDPREKRLRAKLFQLFEANTYLMLDAHALQTGAWIGYSKSVKYGPLKLAFEASMEYNLNLSWSPSQLSGDIWLHGKAEVSVFGFGIGLSLDAGLAANVFKPYHILGQIQATIHLPWPFPDPSIDLRLEWGPELDPPALPVPLQGVAVDHEIVSHSWPLTLSQTAALPQNPSSIPVVPMDCRPTLTFSRPVKDTCLVGVNQPPWPAKPERIGDPVKQQGPLLASYQLTGLKLEKLNSGAWDMVAASPAAAGSTPLYGAWANKPDSSGQKAAQNTLMLWSLTPFIYSKHADSAWDEWFGNNFPYNLCLPEFPAEKFCWQVNPKDIPAPISDFWVCPSAPFSLHWAMPESIEATPLNPPVGSFDHALSFPAGSIIADAVVRNQLSIQFKLPLAAVHLTIQSRDGVEVTAYDDEGAVYGPVVGGTVANPKLEITGSSLTSVVIRSRSEAPTRETITLLEVCGTGGLSAEQLDSSKLLIEHMQDELVHWQSQGKVLEPYTTYRLTVQTLTQAKGEDMLEGYSQDLQHTHYAFFTTSGPPSLAELTPPMALNGAAAIDTGLNDLTRYVDQTIPATVPAPGERPLLPRPVYRGDDIGVQFNEEYVDQLYRMAQQDLGIYLFDNNNQLVRDAYGRIITLTNHWGVADTINLKTSEEQWIQMISQGGCGSFDAETIAKNTTSGTPASGQILQPDTVYEARLIPLLLHEDFATLPLEAPVSGPSNTLGRWQILDALGANNAPSVWNVVKETIDTIESYQLQQLSAIAKADALKSGTLAVWTDALYLPAAHPNQPSKWTDYRTSVYLRTNGADALTLGVVFRYQSAENYYRFAIGATACTLTRVVNGTATLLQQLSFVAQPNRDYLATVDVSTTRIRVYLDGEQLMDVSDPGSPLLAGSVGLYCYANPSAVFSDLRVDDLRAQAPTAYRFSFTTSQFTNFCHMLQSYQDRVWVGAVTSAQVPNSWLSSASAPANAPTQNEFRDYAQIASQVLGAIAMQPVSTVEVTRIERDGLALGWLIQTPEPLNWSRTELSLQQATVQIPAPSIPSTARLERIDLTAADPASRYVDILLLEQASLAGYRLEQRALGVEPAEWQLCYTFGAEPALASGMRIRLYGGDQAVTPDVPAHTVLRFAPLVVQEGADSQPFLPQDGVQLRLVAPSGRIAHMRGFIPPTAYTSKVGLVTRKADGTGFVLSTPLALGQLEPATYCLKLVYKRNIKNIDPSSQILRQAGQDDPEIVELHLPW